jgi:hypothetical protein
MNWAHQPLSSTRATKLYSTQRTLKGISRGVLSYVLGVARKNKSLINMQMVTSPGDLGRRVCVCAFSKRHKLITVILARLIAR